MGKMSGWIDFFFLNRAMTSETFCCLHYDPYTELSAVFFSFFFFFVFVFCFVLFFRAASTAYGGSQARGPIGVTADSLRHSHSNAGSEPHL